MDKCYTEYSAFVDKCYTEYSAFVDKCYTEYCAFVDKCYTCASVIWCTERISCLRYGIIEKKECCKYHQYCDQNASAALWKREPISDDYLPSMRKAVLSIFMALCIIN